MFDYEYPLLADVVAEVKSVGPPPLDLPRWVRRCGPRRDQWEIFAEPPRPEDFVLTVQAVHAAGGVTVQYAGQRFSTQQVVEAIKVCQLCQSQVLTQWRTQPVVARHHSFVFGYTYMCYRLYFERYCRTPLFDVLAPCDRICNTRRLRAAYRKGAIQALTMWFSDDPNPIYTVQFRRTRRSFIMDFSADFERYVAQRRPPQVSQIGAIFQSLLQLDSYKR